MAEVECYIDYYYTLCPDDSTSKGSKRPPRLNIYLNQRKVVLLKTSDETPPPEDEEMSVYDVLKLCDDGLAETLEDTTPPELFKSFDLPTHVYLQRFEFFKALSDIGLGGKCYSDLRYETVKKFEAFADDLRESPGVTLACSFTAYLYVMEVHVVHCMDSISDHDGVLEAADMSRKGSTNSWC